MQALPQPEGPVLVPTSSVRLGAKSVDASSWSVTREISSGLPQRLVGGSGITAATGQVVVSPDVATASTVVSIVDPARRVKAGDRAVVEAGYASTGEARLLTGYVNTLRQGLATNTVTVGLIDDIDRLDRPVKHQALLDVMPPHPEFDTDRSIGLRPEYLVDYALRRSAWHATPPPRGTVAVHAPMMGSAWPHVGTLLQSGSAEGIPTVGLATARCAWGYGLSDGRAYYRPAATLTAASPIELTICLDQDEHDAGARVILYIGDDEVALVIALGSVAARFNGTEQVSLGRSARTVVTLRMAGGTWTLEDDTGATASASRSISGTLTEVRVVALAGALVGGVGVCTPPAGEVLYPVRDWERTAHLSTGGLHQTLIATPDIEGGVVGDLLGDISAALLASMWIDEAGHFHWVHPDRLRSGVQLSS